MNSPSTVGEPLGQYSTSNIDYNEKELILQVFRENCQSLGLTHSNLQHFEILPLHGGSINLNYHVIIKNKHFFVKHQIKTTMTYKQSINREFKILTLLSSRTHQRFVPKPHLFDEANKILITEYISGKKPTLKRDIATELADKMKLVIQTLNDIDLQFLRELCTFTRLTPHQFWKEYAKPRLRLLQKEALICEGGSTELCNILYQVESAISEKLDALDENKLDITWNEEDKPWWLSLIHNDLALRNIIQVPARLNDNRLDFFIIDWEFADSGSIAYDLAFFAAEHQTSVEYVLQFLPLHLTTKQKNIVKHLVITFMPLIDLINAWSILNKLKEYKKIHDQWLSGTASSELYGFISTTKPHFLSMMPYTIDQGLYYSLYRLKTLNHRLGIEYDSTRLFHEAQAILNYFKTKMALY